VLPDTGFIVEFVSDETADDDCNGVERAGRSEVRPELLGGEIPQDMVADADEVAKRAVVGKGDSFCDAGDRGCQRMASDSHEALREFDDVGHHSGRRMEGWW